MAKEEQNTKQKSAAAEEGDANKYEFPAYNYQGSDEDKKDFVQLVEPLM